MLALGFEPMGAWSGRGAGGGIAGSEGRCTSGFVRCQQVPPGASYVPPPDGREVVTLGFETRVQGRASGGCTCISLSTSDGGDLSRCPVALHFFSSKLSMSFARFPAAFESDTGRPVLRLTQETQTRPQRQPFRPASCDFCPVEVLLFRSWI